MKRIGLHLLAGLLLVLLTVSMPLSGQSYRNSSELSLESIMKGNVFMGTPPGNPQWSLDGGEVYFSWNPDGDLLGSDYKYSLKDAEISKLSRAEKQNKISSYSILGGQQGDKVLFVQNGNLSEYNKLTKEKSLILDLETSIGSPQLSSDRSTLFFTLGDNLYKYSIAEGSIKKMTNFVKETAGPEKKKWSNDQEEWLYNDQADLFDILKQNKEKAELRKQLMESSRPKPLHAIPYGKARVSISGIDAEENTVIFTLFNMIPGGKRAEMPRYVTESGFTEISNVRSKVGYTYGSMKLGIFNIKEDTSYFADISSLPGIYDYLVYDEEQIVETREEERKVFFSAPLWSPQRDMAIVNIRSTDNKDRWITLLDFETGKLECLDHQRDEAWISGPGIGWSTSSGTLGWLDANRTIYFQSEESGYSHLYLYDLKKNKKNALTSGKYEVYEPSLSKDKKAFYLSTNKVHSGEKHFYKLDIKKGEMKQLTTMSGQNEVALSSDEQRMIIRYSYATKPWELYISSLSESGDWTAPEQITESLNMEFKAYKWKEPEFILVEASDGKQIPARIYRPELNKSNGCGVVFVHGAGYLQNAHKGWSSYFREYMFHNFLVDNGYTVLDMDYRASAGYGRYWRTAIYRHMGGKDLSDNVDGAKFLVDNEDVDPDKIGIYGGSYGGFITLMAQFTSPGVFKAGAALRPVTDWAHYNHGYTANILNTPVEDPLAYKRSSPIYFADGLQDHLIMCHGMVDDNVHFQDVVRLSQRLIELQKDNWEVAMFPIESHGFKEWTSWLDEYKRIYKLFEETMNVE